MNDQQLDKKVRKDVANVKKDLSALLEHSADRISRYENQASQATGKAKENVTTWVEDGVSNLSKRFETLVGDARKTGVDAATMLKKDVKHGLKQYNAAAENIVNQVPVSFGKKTTPFPWVPITITIIVSIGFLLGILLKPARQSLG